MFIKTESKLFLPESLCSFFILCNIKYDVSNQILSVVGDKT